MGVDPMPAFGDDARRSIHRGAGPRMQSPSLRFPALAAAACLALAMAASAQPQPAPPPAREKPANPEEQVEAPPGVEVLHVRTRESGGIETEVPASLTTFDASTIQALGVQDVAGLSRFTPNVSIV